MGKSLKIILLTILVTVFSKQNSKACDPSCGHYIHIVYGGVITVGTIVLSPIVGALLDKNPNSPYGKALGYTALSAVAVWGIGFAIIPDCSDFHGGAGQILLAALPLITGVATSVIVYNKAKTQDRDMQRLDVGITPFEQGAVATLKYSF